MVNFLTQCRIWLIVLVDTYSHFVDDILPLTIGDLLAGSMSPISAGILLALPETFEQVSIGTVLLGGSVAVMVIFMGISVVKWLVGVFT